MLKRISNILTLRSYEQEIQLRKSFENNLVVLKQFTWACWGGGIRESHRLENVICSALVTDYRKGHLQLGDWNQVESGIKKSNQNKQPKNKTPSVQPRFPMDMINMMKHSL